MPDYRTLPDGWRNTTLGEVCAVNPKRPRLGGVSDDAPVLFVPMASVDEVRGEITSPHYKTLGDVKTKSYTTFAPGDVLFAKITPCMENGKSAVVPAISSGLGFGSTEFHVLRPAKGVHPRFVWHLVRLQSFRREAEAHMTGSVGQARVPAAFLNDFPILLPPESLRNEIVEILDATAKGQRNTTDHLAAAGRAVDRLRQSVLVAACSGQLTTEWRLRHGSQTLPSPAYEDLSEADPLPMRPTDWTWLTPDELRAPDRTITYGVIKLGPQRPEGVPTLRSSDVRMLRIDESGVKRIATSIADNYVRTYLQGGEVLVTVRGSLGGVAVAQDHMRGWNISREVAMIPVGTAALPEYVALAIASPRSQQWINKATKGVTYTGINIRDLKKLPLPIPSMAEQKEILKRVDALFSLGDSIAKRIDAASRAAESGAHAALAKAFAGGE